MTSIAKYETETERNVKKKSGWEGR